MTEFWEVMQGVALGWLIALVFLAGMFKPPRWAVWLWDQYKRPFNAVERWANARRETGGHTGPGMKYTQAGIVHRAEGVVPDGEGGVLHWRDTGEGIEWTRVDPAEWEDDSLR